MDFNTVRLLVNKGIRRRVLRRLMLERFTEPVHLNVAAVFVAACGSFRAKVAFDLVYEAPYAWGIIDFCATNEFSRMRPGLIRST
jgi:hypothetical protein